MSDTNEIFLGMAAWKSETHKAILLEICKTAQNGGILWPDDLGLDFVPDDSKNCIGACFRTVCSSHMKILERNENLHRKSHGSRANGRTVFAYSVINPTLARAFLKRHGQAPKLGQMELIGA